MKHHKDCVLFSVQTKCRHGRSSVDTSVHVCSHGAGQETYAGLFHIVDVQFVPATRCGATVTHFRFCYVVTV